MFHKILKSFSYIYNIYNIYNINKFLKKKNKTIFFIKKLKILEAQSTFNYSLITTILYNFI